MLDCTKKIYLVFVNDKNVVLEYNVTIKKSMKNNQFKNSEMEPIVQFVRSPEGVYVLTENQLRYYRVGRGVDHQKFSVLIKKTKEDKNTEIYLNAFYIWKQKDEGETILASLLQKEEMQICFRSFSNDVVKKYHCFSVVER